MTPQGSSRRGGSRLLGLALPLVLALTVTTGCSSGSSVPTPADLLAKAKTTLDAAPSVHFVLTSQGVPSGAGPLTAGEGVVARPSSFQGTLTIAVAGVSAKVDVVSVDGIVHAKLPLAGFTTVDPKAFGISDPAGLIDPKTGVSSLLTKLTAVTSQGQVRIGSEVAEQVHGTLPGAQVASLLGSADDATAVDATLAIMPDTGQLRRAVLVGPFFAKGTSSTFTIVLDRYGEKVTISAPTG